MGIFKKIRTRIREEVFSDGTKRYHCERTGRILSNKWRHIKDFRQNPTILSFDDLDTYPMIFDRLDEAEEYMASYNSPRVVSCSSTIIKEYE